MLNNDLPLICTLRDIIMVIDFNVFYDFSTLVHVEEIAGHLRSVQVILRDYRIVFNCTHKPGKYQIFLFSITLNTVLFLFGVLKKKHIKFFNKPQTIPCRL